MATVQISGSQIRSATIDASKCNLTAAWDFSSSSGVLVPAPSAGNAPATKTYVDDLISQGISWKQYALVKASSNINLSSAPGTIDSISMSANDRVLVTGQSSGAENGIYKWASAGAAMTRTDDADVFSELQHASIWVQKGTHADKQFIQKADLTGFTGQDWIEITSSSVANGSVTNDSVAANAQIAFSKLAPLTDGQILIGNGSDVPTAQAISGDILISNTGTTSFNGAIIENGDINANAQILLSKLENVPAGKIIVGSVGNKAAHVTMSGDATMGNTGAIQLASSVAGDGLTGGNGTALSVDLDGTTLAKGAGGLKVNNGQIAAAQMNASIAGNGLSIDGSNMSVDTDGSTIAVSGSGIKVADAQITGTQLNTSVAGNGLQGGGGSALSIRLDGTTMAASGTGIKVADAQITATQLNGSVAGNGLQGGAGTALSVQAADASISVAGGGISAGVMATANIADNAITSAKVGARWFHEATQIANGTTGSFDLGRAIHANTINSVMVYKNGLALRNMTALSGSASSNDEFTIANDGSGSVGKITSGANWLQNDSIYVVYMT